MARVNKAAAKPKKKTVRSVRRGANLMPLMPTKGLTWEKAKYYTHYEVESKEWLTTVKAYIKTHYDKKVVSAINKLPDWKIGGKSHWTCAAYLLDNLPDLVPEIYRTGIDRWIKELAEEGNSLVEEKKAEEKTKKNVYVPSIQERIRDQAQAACEAIDEWADTRITDPKNFDIDGFNFVKHFLDTKVTQAHARKIRNWYEPELKEAYIVRDMPTPAQIKKIKNDYEQDMAEQLREGYGHMKKAEIKLWVSTLEKIVDACDMVIDKAKATRKPRVKKAPSKEKLVAKLKYCKQDSKLNLVSINPLDILDASELWVYNIKTRKLGKYVADEYAKTLGVKGTTILGFDEGKSIQKTLRKPDETLKEFKKAGKVTLRKFMDDIKTTDIKLNGRLNSDTIILKCVK
jgi:hypothetical protein